MAYTNNIPQANDRIKDSQPLILANFMDIATAFNANHIAFNSGANTGKHNYLQFPTVQGADIATALGEVAVYSKTGLTAVPALFFRGQSNAAVGSGGFTESRNNTNGWTRLPSGILLKWGVITSLPGGTSTQNFAVAADIPVFTATYNVQLTPTTNVGGNAVPLSIISFNTAGFGVSNSSNALDVYYFAIGR